MKFFVLKCSVTLAASALCFQSIALAQTTDVATYANQLEKMSIEIHKVESTAVYYDNGKYATEGSPSWSESFVQKTFTPATMKVIAPLAIKNGLTVQETIDAFTEHLKAHDRSLTKAISFTASTEKYELPLAMHEAGLRFAETLKLRLAAKANLSRDLSISEIIKVQQSVHAEFTSVSADLIRHLPDVGGLVVDLGNNQDVPQEIFNRFVLEKIQNPSRNLKPLMGKFASEFPKEEKRLQKAIIESGPELTPMQKAQLAHIGFIDFNKKMPSDLSIQHDILDRLTGKIGVRSCNGVMF